MTVKILWKNSNADLGEYKSLEAAAEAILDAFIETNDNPVDEVWMEDDAGLEIPLAPKWQVSLEEI